MTWRRFTSYFVIKTGTNVDSMHERVHSIGCPIRQQCIYMPDMVYLHKQVIILKPTDCTNKKINKSTRLHCESPPMSHCLPEIISCMLKNDHKLQAETRRSHEHHFNPGALSVVSESIRKRTHWKVCVRTAVVRSQNTPSAQSSSQLHFSSGDWLFSPISLGHIFRKNR